MVGGGDGGMASFGGHHGRGSGKFPADCIHEPTEVPPEVVGFLVVRHPLHRGGVIDCGGRSVQRVPTVPF